MIDGRFDQHFLELFAGSSDHKVSPRPFACAVAVAIVIALALGIAPDWLSAEALPSLTLQD